jgi:hypothetical protein
MEDDPQLPDPLVEGGDDSGSTTIQMCKRRRTPRAHLSALHTAPPRWCSAFRGPAGVWLVCVCADSARGPAVDDESQKDQRKLLIYFILMVRAACMHECAGVGGAGPNRAAAGGQRARPPHRTVSSPKLTAATQVFVGLMNRIFNVLQFIPMYNYPVRGYFALRASGLVCDCDGMRTALHQLPHHVCIPPHQLRLRLLHAPLGHCHHKGGV